MSAHADVPDPCQSGSITTRKSAHVFGQYRAICQQDATITGARLPLCRQVLHCAIYHLNHAAKSKRPGSTGATPRYSTAKIVLQQILGFYQKASIPVVAEQTACKKILQLVDTNNKLRAIPKARRETEATRARLQEHEEKLDTTFKLWPPNACELIHNPEDIAFLKSMESDRAATFGSFDQKLADKISRRNSRLEAEEERVRRDREDKETHIQQLQSTSMGAPSWPSTSEEETSSTADEGDTTYDECMTTGTPTTSKRRTGSSVLIPQDILRRQKVVSVATRMKMTPMQTSAFTQTLIEESGGHSRDVASSYSTADRARRQVVASIAEEIKQSWKPGKFCTLHWDGKLTATLTNQSKTEERLTVVVGDSMQLKLLGVPSYKKASNQMVGTVIADQTTALLQSWKCADRIVNMTFDTTTSNTGHVTAACIAIQHKLQRPLLWSGCRHHVGELIVGHVFNDMKIETSKSPDVTLFVRFREKWDQVPHNSSNSDQFRPSDHSDEALNVLNQFKEETVTCAKRVENFVRDDYEELVQLTLLYLGEGSAVIKYNRPGAVHKARWMAKLIYMIKLALSESAIADLPAGTITARQQTPKVRAFTTFITHVYVKWWLTCRSAADAPRNDLELLRRLEDYKLVDKLIAESAIRATKRHLWYLTQEMIPLSLFCEKVPLAEREQLSAALLACKPKEEVTKPQNRYGSSEGKPQFPELTITTSLADLAGPDSWFMFALLQIDPGFLSEPVVNWKQSPAFLASKENISAINVVNDCAERGVKLSSDFIGTARSEEHFQNVIQVVEQDRKCAPNLRKRKLSL